MQYVRYYLNQNQIKQKVLTLSRQKDQESLYLRDFFILLIIFSTNEFPDLNSASFEKHNIADGEYYGRLQGSNREGDGVLSLKKKPIQKGIFL
ncbi:unnamed protein product [Paramecium primaurelia]|uniref:Uncharacterized protein n=1 Tax=Paramecium primaurelia TaxID=5886 RepID=A0A8S1N918_PARPR|nr:unnamed protein product [Paramecium primaurelia]